MRTDKAPNKFLFKTVQKFSAKGKIMEYSKEEIGLSTNENAIRGQKDVQNFSVISAKNMDR